jgi:hypothetical protein
MYKISEVENIELPNGGMECSIKGKFFYRISASSGEDKNNLTNCYITDSSSNEVSKLFLSNKYGESIIDMDETFGMMVGGEFAYYDIDAELKCMVEKVDGKLVCKELSELSLERNGERQQFSFLNDK